MYLIYISVCAFVYSFAVCVCRFVCNKQKTCKHRVKT